MLTERFDAALLLASGLHRKQVRKASEVPYLSHLLAVASLVLEDGGSEDEAIAALLHDSVEDCGDDYPGGRDGLRAHIADQFGPLVLDIVDECTDDDGMPKGKAASHELERDAWRARKQRYLDRIPTISIPALRVSCADKLHNARSTVSDYEHLGDELWTRFRTRSAEDQLWYSRELARAYLQTPLDKLPTQLAREVERLQELMSIRAA